MIDVKIDMKNFVEAGDIVEVKNLAMNRDNWRFKQLIGKKLLVTRTIKDSDGVTTSIRFSRLDGEDYGTHYVTSGSWTMRRFAKVEV